MKIVSYKKKKNNQYEVLLENDKKILLYDDLIINYELLLNKEIDDKLLNKLESENMFYDAYYLSLRYIGIKLRAKNEIISYLRGKNYSSSVIERVVEKLTLEGYLDPKMYISSYINDAINLNDIGPYKIKNNLEKLGLDTELINIELDKKDNEIWQDKIKKIITKKEKTNKLGKQVFIQKITYYLVNLGYTKENIKEVLSTYEFKNNLDVFNKEATKVWNSVKETDYKLKIFKFKNKMYLKGFSTSDIEEFIDKKNIQN